VFFLGLLSTPLPYLLLAAFYFFGFAMGMFNSNSDDEAVDTIAAVTIPVETKQKIAEYSTYYYLVNTDQIHIQADILRSKEDITPFFPDTGTTLFHRSNSKVHEFLYSGYQFSRPPPASC
jgi:hypothetical protein